MLAASPLAATRSQPTRQACTQPFFITMEAILSQISVTSTPARCSSKAVRRAPCSKGRVSSAKTLKLYPFSCPKRMGPRAVPYMEVAMGPALQWVKRPSPGLSSDRPYWEMALFWAISSSWMASASALRAALISLTGCSFRDSAFCSIRLSAQNRLTAVGRDAARSLQIC